MRPSELLHLGNKAFPGLYQKVSEKADHPSPHVFISDQAFYQAIAELGITTERFVQTLHQPPMLSPPLLQSLATWRMGKQVFRFEDTLRSELCRSTIKEVPGSVLERLPVWAPYVEWPIRCKLYPDQEELPLEGFLATVRQGQAPSLLLHFVHLDVETVELELNQDIEQTIEQQIDQMEQLGMQAGNPQAATLAQALRQQKRVWKDLLQGAINLLLYLCSEAEVNAPLKNPTPQKTKRGMVMHVASGEAIIETGYRLGKSLQQSLSQGGGGSLRPHLRRAHWHTYRTGKGREHTTLKWLHPILVGLSEDLPTTIRKIKEEP